MIAVALYIAAALTGVGLAWWSVKFALGGDHTVRAGAWTGSTLSGSTDADILTRARVAVTGLLALGREETMYFVAMQDDSGQKLKGAVPLPGERLAATGALVERNGLCG